MFILQDTSNHGLGELTGAPGHEGRLVPDHLGSTRPPLWHKFIRSLKAIFHLLTVLITEMDTYPYQIFRQRVVVNQIDHLKRQDPFILIGSTGFHCAPDGTHQLLRRSLRPLYGL